MLSRGVRRWWFKSWLGYSQETNGIISLNLLSLPIYQELLASSDLPGRFCSITGEEGDLLLGVVPRRVAGDGALFPGPLEWI